jgi:hypothetical protein
MDNNQPEVVIVHIHIRADIESPIVEDIGIHLRMGEVEPYPPQGITTTPVFYPLEFNEKTRKGFLRVEWVFERKKSVDSFCPESTMD